MWDRQNIMQKNNQKHIDAVNARQSVDVTGLDSKPAVDEQFVGWQLSGRFQILPLEGTDLAHWLGESERKNKKTGKVFKVYTIPVVNLNTDALIQVPYYRIKHNLSLIDIVRTEFEASFNRLDGLSLPEAFARIAGQCFETREGECHGVGARAFYKLFAIDEE